MDKQKKLNVFPRLWKQTQCDDGDQTVSRKNPDGFFTSESKILEMQKAALSQGTDSLFAARQARSKAVLERLGLSVQDVARHSLHPPPVPRQSAKSPRQSLHYRQGRRFCPILDGPVLVVKDINPKQKSPDHSKGDKVHLGSQVAARACKEDQMVDGDRSPTSSVTSVWSSVESDTPRELRAISLIGNPVEIPTLKPTPPPEAVPLHRTRVSRLPVLSTKLRVAAEKKVDGCKLQSVQNHVKATVNFWLNSVPSPRPPAAAKRTPVVTPLAPIPPAVSQTKRRVTRPGMLLRPAKAVSEASKKTASDCRPQTANKKKVELQPLTNPLQSLSLFFQQLSSDDWMKKINGLKTMQALVQHHSETLKTKLHEVCLVLTQEVKNLRSAVSCAAMNTVAQLHVHLQKAMDPEAERTGRALLLKLAQTTNTFIHQQANLALDAMVQNCSHGRVVSALLNAGLSHRCVAVRRSTAQHLHLLADSLGAAHIVTAGRTFTARFLTAVSKMSVDAAPEVRQHGQTMLHDLALHKDFTNLWKKIVPERERRALDKILKKAN
ncbi:uncharacterized protein LOC127371055 isoform X1 [Dicentrarchus labrax]|uniref:uncharacterized protein LOC127371055 isoform X1 n=1 Tax=Dicentrarchus labrax TaxID=13489 RepID=UPI0021F63079|nr:uncharacterized protein LOC127371055 isoform X1 [Dicentrarchus labrax]